MRRLLTVILFVLFTIALSSCQTIPGTVRLEKNAQGEWEAVEVVIPGEDITPEELDALEDLLNGR